MEKATVSPCEIRWMVTADLERVVEIDRSDGERFWPMAVLKNVLRRDVIGIVALVDGRVVGFAVFGFSAKMLVVKKLVVDPRFRRRGVGSAIVRKLKGKLMASKPTMKVGIVETDLDALNFFKAQGFRAKIWARNAGPSGRDIFQMSFSLDR